MRPALVKVSGASRNGHVNETGRAKLTANENFVGVKATSDEQSAATLIIETAVRSVEFVRHDDR